MPRRKPFSAKQKKEQLQQKRAIKRGDIDPPPIHHSDRKGKGRAQLPGQIPRNSAAAESSRKLESSFVKLNKAFLEETRRLSASIPLQRPIPSEIAVWNDAVPSGAVHDGGSKPQQLTCPRRPKWRYDMSKKEVEKNEEGLFQKWLDQTDAAVNTWCEPPVPSTEDRSYHDEVEIMPRAPTRFERNLEVWRQL